jgi:hypothetical protein
MSPDLPQGGRTPGDTLDLIDRLRSDKQRITDLMRDPVLDALTNGEDVDDDQAQAALRTLRTRNRARQEIDATIAELTGHTGSRALRLVRGLGTDPR